MRISWNRHFRENWLTQKFLDYNLKKINCNSQTIKNIAKPTSWNDKTRYAYINVTDFIIPDFGLTLAANIVRSLTGTLAFRFPFMLFWLSSSEEKVNYSMVIGALSCSCLIDVKTNWCICHLNINVTPNIYMYFAWYNFPTNTLNKWAQTVHHYLVICFFFIRIN